MGTARGSGNEEKGRCFNSNKGMNSGGAAKLIVDALLQQFLPLARRRIETAQIQDGQYLSPSDPTYDQVLDSLAMVARNTPVPLLEALLRWRESESPKGPNDASAFQRKLSVECIFCSACIRFVECCPQEGLTEKLWSGLENFLFDWLINADRIVSQVDYPSLVDLRGLLLDHVAQLLGALSHIRFNSLTERFFMEINTRRIDTSAARSEALSIIHGMRYLKLRVKTEVELNASATFLAKVNPLSRAPHKRKSELHHALCNMLSNILVPLAECQKSRWPPIGVDRALFVWYDVVARLRLQLMQWMDKKNKHISVGYPLVSILLCLGEPQFFQSNFGPHMEQLYKLLRDKNQRFMALDCLHHVVRFYLRVYAPSHLPNRVWDNLDSVTSQLLSIMRKGMLTQDVQHDKLVEFCATIAESNLDFAMNHLVLELLRPDTTNEAKVIGLRALQMIVVSPSSRQYVGLELFQVHGIGHYIPKVKAAIEAILRSCHRTYSQALLTSSKATIDSVTKEKSQGYLFQSVLKCIPDLTEEVGRSDKISEVLPQHGISIDPGVREEAVQVLYRIVKSLPNRRFAVMRGMANFTLRLPDDFPLLIQTSLGRLLELMQFWRVRLYEERLEFDAQDAQCNLHGDSEVVKRKPSVHKSGEAVDFRAPEIDAVGLIFLCSVDGQIRHTALELLKCVRALKHDIREYALHEREDYNSKKNEPEPIFIIDVLEEHGDDIVHDCYWDSELRREYEVVPPDVTIQTTLFESLDKNRWARCLSELVKYAVELCPKSVQEARSEILRRLSYITPNEFGGKGSQFQDGENKLEQWLMYAMFACSCPQHSREAGSFKSTKDLFRLTFAALKSGSESLVQAATMALGHAHFEVCEVLFSELAFFIEELSMEADCKSKWKSQRSRRDELRAHVANIYRSVAEKIWPGMLIRKPGLRHHFLKFIEDTTRQILMTSPDSFQDMQSLRYAVASVLRCLAPEFVESKSEKFDLRTRKRLFDLLYSWSDDMAGLWSQDGGLNDYRREVERYKSSQHWRSKDSVDKLSFDRELIEQVEAIQWASLGAMVSLLYGPCFEDNVRKMSGRVISWINSLFVEPTPRFPVGHSPADSRTPSYSKLTAEGVRGGSVGRDRQKTAQLRVNLAKLALKNLLLTNLDLFSACIDQCYYSDAAIADGYFSVLADVYMRQEIPKCEVQSLLSLILYKVVDPSRQIRDDALQMLETLSVREWAEVGFEDSESYRAAVVGNLPDSYQQFQYKLSCKLAKDHPELSQLLCEEIMQRQLDAVDIIAQHQVLTCMAPWIENLNFWKLTDGWTERLLKSLYYVTWRHGDQFPDEIEKLWSTIASKSRNISPVLDFLITKGIEDCDSNASAEISGAFATYFSVAKRVSLYLARICPQRTIDHLVYQLSQRMLEESCEIIRLKGESDRNILEFSQGPVVSQMASIVDSQPYVSPLLVRGSIDVPLRSMNGNVSWFTAGGCGRSGSGQLSSIGPELYMLPVNQVGRSGQVVVPSLANMSSPFIGIRSSAAGTVRSRHMSRDSGDCYIDTPSSGEDGLHSNTASVHGVSAKELQSALQVHQQHTLTRADIALILLAEIAYENDEDFREHLPLLFHVVFVSMDSSEDIVLEHCQHLLVNLLYSLAGRHLELYEDENSDGENKQQVVSLIKYVLSKRGSIMWENEDPSLQRPELPSTALLAALVQSMVDAVFFQGDLRETWGTEALKWAMECSSRHLACRSHQIYRALRPKVTSDACVSLLRCLYRCLGNPVPKVLGFVMEILLTLQVMVEDLAPEKVILYPQLFWGCVAMMHTDFIHVYCQVLELFLRVIDRLTFQDKTTENVLLSSMPRDVELDNSIVSEMGEFRRMESRPNDAPVTGDGKTLPPFEGVQPLVLKGLTSTVSHGISIEVMSRITLPCCDSIFGDPDTRLLMHITGLLPWLCLQLSRDPLDLSSPLNHQYEKACSTAANLAYWCRVKSQDGLSTVLVAYSHGEFKAINNLLASVAPLLCHGWFPKHSALAFSHLLRLLERGPVEYQRVILLLLKELLQHTAVVGSQNSHMFAAVSRLVEGPLGGDALTVLEALLHSTADGGGGYESGAFDNGLGGVGGPEERLVIPQTSFKSRSWLLSYNTGSGFGTTQGQGGQSGPAGGGDSVMAKKEAALQNTKSVLGRVLDSCALGRNRDFKRFVPFASSTGNP